MTTGSEGCRRRIVAPASCKRRLWYSPNAASPAARRRPSPSWRRFPKPCSIVISLRRGPCIGRCCAIFFGSRTSRCGPSPPTKADTLQFARTIREHFYACLAIRNGKESDTSIRVMMASLAGDGRYARIIYRRALTKRRPLRDQLGPHRRARRRAKPADRSDQRLLLHRACRFDADARRDARPSCHSIRRRR